MKAANPLEPPLLQVRELVTRFYTPEGIVHAVNEISFQLEAGETLGIVGESGCGKSVTMLSLLRLIPHPPGRIERGVAEFDGRDLLEISLEELRQIRGGQIGMVFQDPMTSLNPVMTIGSQLIGPMRAHLGITIAEAKDGAVELLELVGIPNAVDRLDDYPHQFSGGMRQRVMIAMALSCSPRILIADEPTTALDVTIQAQIIDLINRLQEQLDMAVIWITHDLGIIAEIAERVMVMYAGYVIEEASVRELYRNPLHPYTIGLLGSLPRMDQQDILRLANIKGRPPSLYREPAYCPFAPRCSFVKEECWERNPQLRPVSPNHNIACWVDVQQAEKELFIRD
jgi:oligopeptide/dipeptide ABC transporter ATP-binding protein